MASYLITGITGQDGRIAAATLGGSNRVYGISHRGIPEKAVEGIQHCYTWDWESEDKLEAIIEDVKPDYLLNFAAYHHSSSYPPDELYVHDNMIRVNLNGLFKIIKCLLKTGYPTKLVHASSSQIFTPNDEAELVSERSAALPMTFYGYTKKSGMNLIDYYRRTTNFNGCSAILFNHESAYRSTEFLTRTISSQVAKIAHNRSETLHLRNIGAAADFSAAEDFISAIISICRADLLDDVIVSSAKSTSVKDLLQWAFETIDRDWRDYVTFDRDEAGKYVVGDNTVLKRKTNWQPAISMQNVMHQMVEYDLKELKVAN